MDDRTEDHLNPNLGLERETPENSVCYLLFVLDRNKDARQVLRQLEAVRQAALKLCRDLTDNYIWQRDAFDLELRTEGGKCLHNDTKKFYETNGAPKSWSTSMELRTMVMP